MAKNLDLFESKPDAVTNYTHSFFPYPAKFPAEPIREFILKYSCVGDTVLDPFCGSGTVLVESLLNRRSAHGIELNPVAALVSQAKATIYRDQHKRQLKEFLAEIRAVAQKRDEWIRETITQDDIPAYKNVDLWFKPNILQELTAIRKTFLSTDRYLPETKRMLWMAFLKIIVSVSNQDGETRYASIDKPELVDGYAINKMYGVVSSYERVLENSEVCDLEDARVSVEKNDANIGLDKIQESSIDLAITSPPYINTFDYYLYHKHRIFWMNENPQEIRRREIGCHHRIDTMTHDNALLEYSSYMKSVLGKVHAKLKQQKRFVILIGDGIVKNQLIEADKLIIELASQVGFEVEEVTTIKLREVSRGFIKGKSLDRKSHHAIVLQK